MLKNDLFLRACRKEDIERTPVWLMRQAGRYLPEYRAVREKHDFLTMCKTPELVTEVTIQPIDLIGTDAAILFSDILVIPEAMGMELNMIKGIGPVFSKPIRTESDINNLASNAANVVGDLSYVMDGIKMTKQELAGRVPLIGFSGSPWTLLCYMIEGRGSKTFSKVKEFCYTQPVQAHKILSLLADIVGDYLSAKIEAGVNAVQIFDTWGGILDQPDYLRFSLRYMEQAIGRIRKKDNEPIIVFSKGVHHSLMSIVRSGADVIGLDWSMDLGYVRQRVGDKIALQGNLDPSVLYADRNTIREKVIQVLDSHGKGSGHVFNLGHGLQPDMKPANVKFMVDCVKEMSAENHEHED